MERPGKKDSERQFDRSQKSMAARVWVIWTTGRARAASGWSGQEKLHTCVCTRASVAREDCHVGGARGRGGGAKADGQQDTPQMPRHQFSCPNGEQSVPRPQVDADPSWQMSALCAHSVGFRPELMCASHNLWHLVLTPLRLLTHTTKRSPLIRNARLL